MKTIDELIKKELAKKGLNQDTKTIEEFKIELAKRIERELRQERLMRKMFWAIGCFFLWFLACLIIVFIPGKFEVASLLLTLGSIAFISYLIYLAMQDRDRRGNIQKREGRDNQALDTRIKRNIAKWPYWLGIVASGLVLGLLALKAKHFVGHWDSALDILLYLVLAVLPSFLNVFLTALGYLWWSFGIGLWLTFLAVLFLFDKHASPESMTLLLATVTVCLIPFLNRARAIKKGKADEFPQPKDLFDKQNGTWGQA
jgi:hypothetical protein